MFLGKPKVSKNPKKKQVAPMNVLDCAFQLSRLLCHIMAHIFSIILPQLLFFPNISCTHTSTTLRSGFHSQLDARKAQSDPHPTPPARGEPAQGFSKHTVSAMSEDKKHQHLAVFRNAEALNSSTSCFSLTFFKLSTYQPLNERLLYEAQPLQAREEKSPTMYDRWSRVFVTWPLSDPN